MSEPTSEAEIAALNSGKGEGLALAALALSVVSFLNLVGAEKAILAITLAVLALRRTQSRHIRRRCWIAIAIGSAYFVFVAILVVLMLFHDKLGLDTSMKYWHGFG